MELIRIMLKNRLSELERNVERINNRINKYPQGYLKIKKVKDKFYYRIVDKENMHERYLAGERGIEARIVAQRDYDYQYLKLAQKEIKYIEKLLNNNSMTLEDCYSKLHDGRKILVEPFELSDEDYINKWMDMKYISKEFNENDETEYYTEKGERMRSKSEVIIANILKSLNIPYKYECPLRLDQITIYPDFTILDVKKRREIYLEHFGMMGDQDYVSNMMLKINTYERNGVMLGDRLICTFESSKRPLNVNILKQKLQLLFK